MTITYQKHVSNTSFMGFAKLLFKWRGSIYKLVFKELLLYGGAYAVISCFYRFYMTDEQKRVFEKVALYCNQTAGLMPMSFVLGFYVTFVVTRWWNQFLNLPWPDRVTHTLTMYVNGADERGRVLRRTLARYVNLATIILFQTISGSAKKRFPTMMHLIEAGLITQEEKQMFDNINISVNKHWIPYIWFINLVNLAVKEGRIQQGEPVKQILEEVNNMRTKTGHLWGHDWVTVPLVYTQVVTLLTHLYFCTCLVGRQFLDPEQGYKGHDIDLFFPVYTFLQFFFFLGWLKVAEQLINPFGEDDDDFEINWFIDRNIQVSYLIVDDMYGKLAKIEKDQHFGRGSVELPYTEAALSYKAHNYKGSTMDMVVSPKEQAIIFTTPDRECSRQPPTHFQNFVRRYCCCCAPPLNKPLGESYGVREPFNFEQYDAKRKASNYSIFGETYFNIINRGKRESQCSELSLQHASETTALTTPNNASIRRHRPSIAITPALTSVTETDQELSDAGVDTSPSNHVKLALAFLDEDLDEIVEE
ncbi:bestrophin-2-like [Uloborus diversus]|uniref:bestrophin-2-like n=1 Tax=Uloborus diversus TaxID=327109 RepID=UPI00240A2733|nr:bestrophin-2-like [Uloborus diversus]